MKPNKATLISALVFFFFQNIYAYVPRWENICREKVKKKSNLYEIYNDCLEVCMPEFSLFREKKIKEKVNICTKFTARLHNTTYKNSDKAQVSRRLKSGIRFCQEQKLHKTGGHWPAISRNCKKIICDYNPKITAENHPECKDIYKNLHNGKVEAVTLPAKPSQPNTKN